MRSCERQPAMDSEVRCPLCDVELLSLTLLRRHLGKHHEELSLFALPSYMKDHDDEVADDEAASDNSDSPAAQGVASSVGMSAQQNESDPLLVAAKDLLRLHPASVLAADDMMFDPTLIAPSLRKELPLDVNTWAELKQWAVENERVTSPSEIDRIMLSQALQIQIALTNQEADACLEQLVNFYEREGVSKFAETVITIDERYVNLSQILRAIYASGGFAKLAKDDGWASIRHPLSGHRISPHGADAVKALYNNWVLPFEESRNRNSSRISRENVVSSLSSLWNEQDKKSVDNEVATISNDSLTAQGVTRDNASLSVCSGSGMQSLKSFHTAIVISKGPVEYFQRALECPVFKYHIMHNLRPPCHGCHGDDMSQVRNHISPDQMAIHRGFPGFFAHCYRCGQDFIDQHLYNVHSDLGTCDYQRQQGEDIITSWVQLYLTLYPGETRVPSPCTYYVYNSLVSLKRVGHMNRMSHSFIFHC